MKLQLIALLLFVTRVNTYMRPTYYIVGLMRKCSDYELFVPDSWHCLNIGKETIAELETQASHVCVHLETLTHAMRNHSPSSDFNLVGFDQGGLVARLVLKTCTKVKGLVKRLFTFGTPHIGTTEAANLYHRGEQKTTGKYLKEGIMGAARWVNNALFTTYAYKQYHNDKNGSTDFFDSLYGDKPKPANKNGIVEHPNPSDDYDGLELMVNVMRLRDEMKPANSAIFGTSFDAEKLEFGSFSNTHAAKRSPSLTKLYQSGRMLNCVHDSAEGPLVVDRPDFAAAEILALFSSDCEELKKSEPVIEKLEEHEDLMNLKPQTSIVLESQHSQILPESIEGFTETEKNLFTQGEPFEPSKQISDVQVSGLYAKPQILTKAVEHLLQKGLGVIIDYNHCLKQHLDRMVALDLICDVSQHFGQIPDKENLYRRWIKDKVIYN